MSCRSHEKAIALLNNTRLGLSVSSAIHYLLGIEDLEGRLPEKRNDAYNEFIESFRRDS